MPDKADLLLDLYKEHCNWERHHETQRSSVTSILVAVAAGILGIVTFDGHINTIDLPLTSFLIIMGLFGVLFSAKQYSSFSQHQERANKIRETLNTLIPAAKILELRKEADEIHRKKNRIMSKLRLHYFWNLLHVLIAIIGSLLTIGALLQWFG
jgi:amino acid transporter